MKNWNPKEVEDWKSAAIELYFRQHGRRCVKCSEPVALEDAKLYRLGERDFVLTHKKCRRGLR